MRNQIEIERQVDGYSVHAYALYVPEDDGWHCSVRERRGGPIVEARGPEETGNDVWGTLTDMIDVALDDARARHAMCAGPFSTAQCAR